MIFGASTRAAAFSALRAGLQPWCADLFADQDLARHCPVTRLSGAYPHAFLDLATSDRAGAWIYTGGLENHPDLLLAMSRHRQIWGVADTSKARDPSFVSQTLGAANLSVPAIQMSQLPPPTEKWLVKPLAGCGGRGIRFWSGANDKVTAAADCYFQRFIEGEPHSAVYAAIEGETTFLGLTRQLVGEPWLNAADFRYCGSIGPVQPSPKLQRRLEKIGTVLASTCGLSGLFGVDGILQADDFWPVEVNPRYTASVEVLEYATGLQALTWHHRAFVPAEPMPKLTTTTPSIVGKAILYARQNLVFPSAGPWQQVLEQPVPLTDLPEFADIPAAGEVIEAGRPVVTLFVRAPDPDSCRQAMKLKAAALDCWLYDS